MHLKRANHLIINFAIISSFGLLAFFNFLLIIKNQQISLGTDLPFHGERIRELIQSTSLLPRYNLNSFGNIGSAVMTMYPGFSLYPIIFFLHFISSIKTVLQIVFSINIFICTVICYYCSQSLKVNFTASYLFALMYTLSREMIIYYFGINAIDMYYTALFIPIVIFGFIHWLKNSHWLMLTIGMSLIIFNSVIMSAIIISILFIWTAWNCKKLNRHKIINLIKAILLTLGTTACFWIPASKTFILNQLNTPTAVKVATVNFMSTLKSSLTPSGNNSPDILTIYSLLGIVIGITIFKRLKPLSQQGFIIAIGILFLGSNLFPWLLLERRFPAIKTIQYTSRMFIIPQILLTWITAIELARLFKRIKNKPNRLLGLIVMISGILLIGINNQRTFLTQYHDAEFPKSRISNQQVIGLDNCIIHYSSKDYYPKRALPQLNQLLQHRIINKHKSLKTISKGHGIFIYRSHHNLESPVLPFLGYYGTNYHGIIGNRSVSLSINRQQLLKATQLPRGTHQLTITIQHSQLTKISNWLTAISFLIMFIILAQRILIQRKAR